MSDFWKDHAPDGDFPPMFPLPNTGGWQASQSIEGVITKERTYTFDPAEGPTPIIELRDDAGNEHSVACGAIRLKAQMFSLRPPLGSRVRITCTGKEGKSNQFLVEVLVPGSGVAPAAAVAPQAAPVPAYAPAPAAPSPYPQQAPAAPPAQPGFPPQEAYQPPPMPAPQPQPAASY